MSPSTIDTHSTLLPFVPISDCMDRHEYGVQKNRKSSQSIGSGRAWSEDEEVYLLQTRLQKTPYKHIATHLKKTELACRLHYHQLSHGSSRRKRTASIPSSGSTVHSPILGNVSLSRPSPIREHSSPSFPSSFTISPIMPHAQLPLASSLLKHAASENLSGNAVAGHIVALSPKPIQPCHPFSDHIVKLNCNEFSTINDTCRIDHARLSQIYESHRVTFWGLIAADYGRGVEPLVLEQAFRNNFTLAPPTPCGSLDTDYHKEQNEYIEVKETKPISVSALLGIDANPTSPQERELVRRMEARKGSLVKLKVV